MITDEVFRKIEGMLYRYFKDKKEIERIKYKIISLEGKKNRLEYILSTTDITLKVSISAVNYDGINVQTSNTDSLVERELVREIEKIEEELVKTVKKILKLKTKVTLMEERISDMNYILSKLSDEAKDFIEYKYGHEKTLDEISIRLNTSKATESRRRKNIVKDIAKFYNFCETKLKQKRNFIA
ncbi:hypothetical protein [Tepidibacter thalassicus]|uniref:Sigma-70, region 4 n=1 Tax=Tepidibacter thalassicus DSM 15285 TaxID=1123350 RepID=A0A1M5PXX1_9FIRM|nr:hypothetical protein [Tepidibacter thalassicus]SHH06113.1 hypothetical protein SAMN02744040_00643 [Tepidibacter thalassicus DSM 15285]